MKNFSLISILLFLISSCTRKDEKQNSSTIALNYLNEKGYVEDHTTDAEIEKIIDGLNILTRQNAKKYFTLASNYKTNDANQILIVPFRKKSQGATPTAFSSIQDNLVFICPLQIKEFVLKNSISDSTDITGYLGLILLHELGHFSLKISGSFDESILSDRGEIATIGEQDLGTDPVVLNLQKRLELKIDSLAVESIRKGIKIMEGTCSGTCFSIEFAITNAQFNFMGRRIIKNFGTAKGKTILDESWTHPNLELRLAFMNYYLNPTIEQWNQINDYLYQREIAPILLQETDPRIFQGRKKLLE